MKKAANLILAIAVPITFVGASILFYFRYYDSIATYLIVLLAGLVTGISLLRGVLGLAGKLK